MVNHSKFIEIPPLNHSMTSAVAAHKSLVRLVARNWIGVAGIAGLCTQSL